MVVLQQLFSTFPVRRVRPPPRVGQDVVPGLRKKPCSVFGRRDGQGVDDATAGHVGEVCQQPAQPIPGIGQGKDT